MVNNNYEYNILDIFVNLDKKNFFSQNSLKIYFKRYTNQESIINN
jgi:hypothetical protein